MLTYEDYVNNLPISNNEKNIYLHVDEDEFYVNQQSNIQIITYINQCLKKNNIYMLTRLYLLFNNFVGYNFTNRLINGIKEKKYNDTQIYKYILKHPEEHFKNKKNPKLCSQYSYTFEELALKINLLDPTNCKYLDFGCGECYKTSLFGNKLKIPNKNIYGTDIKFWGPYTTTNRNDKINFKFIEDNKIMYNDDYFDVISCILVLHHIQDDEQNKILKEIKRVLKPNGLLIIIEHNIINDYDHIIVDIEHSMYEHINNESLHSYSKYFNKMQLNYLFLQHDFKLIDESPIYNSLYFETRYDSPYWFVYQNN